MKKTEREPILLADQIDHHSEYLRKLRSCEKHSAKFKEVFIQVITENLGVPFTKEWIKITIDGQLEDRLYNELTKFLSKQPKLMHKAITEEFYKITVPLHETVYNLKNAFEKLPYESELMGRMFPADMVDFAGLPIDEQGNFNLSDEWQTAIKPNFRVYVTTEKEFEKYDLLQDLLTIKKRFKEVHQANAPYLWQYLAQNFNEIGNELTIRSVK